MGWLGGAIMFLFNAAIWEGARHGRIPLADLPALHGWMKADWPAMEPGGDAEDADA
jgi:hypothetical protein